MKLASIVSLIVSIILFGAKFWGFRQTGSQAVFSDAMESIVNVAAASLAMVVLAFARKPADKEHPYGHGKVEFFSAAFEGGLISFASVVICYEAMHALYHGRAVQELGIGVGITLGTGIANAALGAYLIRVGRKNHSAALEASGHHVLTDFWTSLGVAGGLVGVALTGLAWLDPLVALLMGAILARTGFKLVRRSIGGLLDEEDHDILEHLIRSIERERMVGLIQVHHVRVMRAGAYHHIDAHAVVPEYWTVSQAHAEMDEFESRLIKDYPFAGELHLHVDPCRQVYCRACEVADCPVRQKPFEHRRQLSVEELTSPEEPTAFKSR